MFSFLSRKLRLHESPRDLVLLALVNGLSGMALNGAAIFGMLAILSGATFLHGISGLAVYVALNAVATFVGYAVVCRYGAVGGLKAETVLYAVFIIHAVGFICAAFIHPICVALSAGFGLGMFYAVFMLKSLNGIDDRARDGYATVNGLIQQSLALAAPLLGVGTLYVGTRLGLHNAFFPTFLTFALCVLFAIPVIRRMPHAPLPCNIALPLKAVAEAHHVPAIGLFFFTIFCECLMYPLLLLSSFALLGKVVEVGWFSALITALAFASLALSHRVRLLGRRWVILGVCLVGIGFGFAGFDLSFRFETLLIAGAAYALCRVNYNAIWFSFSSQVIEREWGHFGKNQALVLAELFFLTARMGVAVLLLVCGGMDLSFRQCLTTLIAFYLLSATISIALARFISMKHRDA